MVVELAVDWPDVGELGVAVGRFCGVLSEMLFVDDVDDDDVRLDDAGVADGVVDLDDVVLGIDDVGE